MDCIARIIIHYRLLRFMGHEQVQMAQAAGLGKAHRPLILTDAEESDGAIVGGQSHLILAR